MFFLHEVDEPPGISQAADGDDVDDVVVQSQSRFFDAFQTADFLKVEEVFVSRFACLQINQCPQSCFHDTATVAKNRAASGRLAEDRVII